MSDSSPESITIQCPACDSVLTMPSSCEGERVACVRCLSEFVASTGSEEEEMAREASLYKALAGLPDVRVLLLATVTGAILLSIVLAVLLSFVFSWRSENPVALPATFIFWLIFFSVGQISCELQRIITLLEDRDKRPGQEPDPGPGPQKLEKNINQDP